MPDVAKLKKKAAEFELKKQFDKALAVYVEILDGFKSSDEEVDVSLFNRVGDLYLKQGNVTEAVDYYEQAVDRYAEGGFHNNAIALCNKILRSSPGRASVYYKLGKISAQKGFKADAKKNFLEYADRMQSAGRIDEAFRALKEFADLCPDQDDIRLMLADQLSKKGRADEAIEQLQLLYERYSHDGRDAEARATIDRMKAIDPAAEPKALRNAPSRDASDLVFLDLNDDTPKRNSIAAKRVSLGLQLNEVAETALPVSRTPPASPIVEKSPELPMLDTASMTDLDRGPELDLPASPAETGSLLDGLESTSLAGGPPAPAEDLLEFEPTFSEPTATPAAASAAVPADDLLDFDLGADTPAPPSPAPARPLDLADDVAIVDFGLDEEVTPPVRSMRPSLMGLPMLTDEQGEEPAAEDDGGSIGGDLELIMPEETPARGTPLQTPLPIDLPMMDLDAPVAPARRQSIVSAELDLEQLRALSDVSPDDNLLRRRFAEALIESGDRDGGLNELENAMVGFERNDDLASAASLADEIVLLNPGSVKHHQKRVEYAFRTNEKGRLIEAYVQLADALYRASQLDKSRAIYQRVIDLAPDDLRALTALESFPAVEPEVEPQPTGKTRSSLKAARASAPKTSRVSGSSPTTPPPPSPKPDDEYVNLGDWLRDDEGPKDTRMVVDEKEPTGDEAADFADMLQKFKQGISENVEDEDHQSHYDLGVAYKEMGLVDEAIAEFQKALRAPTNRVPTYEALGHCFIEKEQYQMAATILGRGLNESGMTEGQLIGILYLLGQCAEQRGQRDAAIEYYQRVFVVDIQFRDVGERLAAVEGAKS